MTLIANTCGEIAAMDTPACFGVWRERVQARLDQLTKPPGSLGRLEELALRVGEIQGTAAPRAERKLVVVMAGDHGVTASGVSAYPQEVTAQMVRNFEAGGAAINVLARHAGARVRVVEMGVRREGRGGTRSFLEGDAMTEAAATAAVERGIEIAHEEAGGGLDLIAGGDMGIGNSTSSSAIVGLVTGHGADVVVGRGTGLDEAGMARKRAAVARALERHAEWREERGGVALLGRVGGFEIAGLAGVMLGAASRRVPVVLDGFIATAAALAAAEMCPAARHFLIAAHRSAEPGHAVALRHLGLDPLLEWELRLGEGTGAALAFPLIEAACKIVAEMATFASAGVSDGTNGPSVGHEA